MVSTTTTPLEAQSTEPLGQLLVDPEGEQYFLSLEKDEQVSTFFSEWYGRLYLSRSTVVYIIWHGDLESIATTHITGKSVQNIVIKNYDLEAKKFLPLTLN